MRIHFITLLACSVMLFGFQSSFAQSGNTGLKFSKYGGIMSTMENPAFGAGQEIQWETQIFNINNTTEIQGLLLPWNQLLTDGKLSFGDVQNAQGDKQFSFRNALEVSGPAAFYNYKKKFSVGFTTRTRLFLQLNDANLRLADAVFAEDGFDFKKYGPIKEDYVNFNLQAMSDIGITGSAQVLNIKNHKLYAGLSLRYYQGLAAFDFTAKNVDIDPDKIINSDSVVAFSADLEMNAGFPVDLDILNSSDDGEVNFGQIINPFNSGSGNGIGGDVGVAYMGQLFDKNVRAGLSVTDIGRINYRRGAQYGAYFRANNVSIPIDSFENIPCTYDSIRTWAKGYGIDVDTAVVDDFVQQLPTRINFYAEVELGLGFVVGLSSSGNLIGQGSKRSTYGGYTALIPRWQNKWLEVWAPVSYNYFTERAQVGFGARLAYFYFGSDNVLGLLSTDSRGANVYLGFRVAGNFKKPKKKDAE